VGSKGDGINDAPALRAADIDVNVDSSVDIILLEASLLVLDDGVVEGSTTFCNMPKFSRTTASSHFGNVLSVWVVSAFLPFLPMQLLLQNLLCDFGQTGISFDNVDPERVTRPLKWNPINIACFMLFPGPSARFSTSSPSPCCDGCSLLTAWPGRRRSSLAVSSLACSRSPWSCTWFARRSCQSCKAVPRRR